MIFLDNAIKYSPENSEINLSAKKFGSNILIEIKDRGIGIEEKEIPLLFERFYRADKARTKKDTDGFGLGLSIAKQIVEKHNGSIEVKSKPGSGTIFQIKLPDYFFRNKIKVLFSFLFNFNQLTVFQNF